MQKPPFQAVLAASLVLFGGLAQANVPSAYLACARAEPGDTCTLVGPEYGKCVLDTLCTPNSMLDVNNCLLCVDPCWDQADGTACVRRDGLPGVCQLQERCTDDPFRSFSECNRCVEVESVADAGIVEMPEPKDDSGCVGAELGGVTWRGLWPWALVLLGLGLQARRRRVAGHARR
jgi:hypothetical protein